MGGQRKGGPSLTLLRGNAIETAWAGRISCREWMRRDEELLASGRPAAQAGMAEDRAISLGAGHRVAEVEVRRWEALGLPVLRRSTGGSALLHLPGDLLWTRVVPRSELPRGFVREFAALGAPIAEALTEAGAPAAWGEPLGLSERFCLFGSRGRVLLAGDRAIGGAAQHLAGPALLHHGVVGRSLDRGLLSDLFGVPAPLLEERLTSLDEQRGETDPARIGQRFLELVAGERSAPRDGEPPIGAKGR